MGFFDIFEKLSKKLSKKQEEKNRIKRIKRSKSDQYKANPNPQQAYQIIIEIGENTPGPLVFTYGLVYYNSFNHEFWVSKFAGATGTPEHNLNIVLEQVAERTFVGIAYLDGMLDEDYFGSGVSHWQLTGVDACFKATGAEEETPFVIYMSARNEILPENPITLYYNKSIYPSYSDPTFNFASFGERDINNYLPHARNNLFTISAVAKRL